MVFQAQAGRRRTMHESPQVIVVGNGQVGKTSMPAA